MKWALVIWSLSPDSFQIFERFQTLEQCLQKRETVQAAFAQADSDFGSSCRPIKPGGARANSDIVIHRLTIR